MPRFFFHVHHGSDQGYIDRIGENLPDGGSAFRMATRYAGESIRDLDGELKPDAEWRLDVSDTRGRLLYCISVTVRCLT